MNGQSQAAVVGAKQRRYSLSPMATPTATIRVTRETRDLLAREASERGVSLSAMLADLARDVAREAVFRSEREATRADAVNRDAMAEQRVWEATLGDGID
jgi:uncharacterized protein (DUF1778 family)